MQDYNNENFELSLFLFLSIKEIILLEIYLKSFQNIHILDYIL